MATVMHLVVLNRKGEIIRPPKNLRESMGQFIRRVTLQGGLVTQDFVFELLGYGYWGSRAVSILSEDPLGKRIKLTATNRRTGADGDIVHPMYCFSPRDGIRMVQNNYHGNVIVFGDEAMYDTTLDLVDTVIAAVCTNEGVHDMTPLGEHPLANQIMDQRLESNPNILWSGQHSYWVQLPIETKASAVTQ